MARSDTQIRLEELESLKGHLRAFNGSRLSKLRHPGGDDPEADDAGIEPDEAHGTARHERAGEDAVEAPEAGDEEGGKPDFEGAADDAEVGEPVTCQECGGEVEDGVDCPHCGAPVAQEQGGEGEESDRERLAKLAKRR